MRCAELVVVFCAKAGCDDDLRGVDHVGEHLVAALGQRGGVRLIEEVFEALGLVPEAGLLEVVEHDVTFVFVGLELREDI